MRVVITSGVLIGAVAAGNPVVATQLVWPVIADPVSRAGRTLPEAYAAR